MDVRTCVFIRFKSFIISYLIKLKGELNSKICMEYFVTIISSRLSNLILFTEQFIYPLHKEHTALKKRHQIENGILYFYKRVVTKRILKNACISFNYIFLYSYIRIRTHILMELFLIFFA